MDPTSSVHVHVLVCGCVPHHMALVITLPIRWILTHSLHGHLLMDWAIHSRIPKLLWVLQSYQYTSSTLEYWVREGPSKFLVFLRGGGETANFWLRGKGGDLGAWHPPLTSSPNPHMELKYSSILTRLLCRVDFSKYILHVLSLSLALGQGRSHTSAHLLILYHPPHHAWKCNGHK